jgi:hypothetical protein
MPWRLETAASTAYVSCCSLAALASRVYGFPSNGFGLAHLSSRHLDRERGVLVPATDRGALRAAAALAGKQKAHSLTFFDGFGLNAAITRAIAEAKHGALGQIQEQTISIAMSRRDAICTAQTGIGKTAVFAPPILQHLVTDERPADTAQRLQPAVTHDAH